MTEAEYNKLLEILGRTPLADRTGDGFGRVERTLRLSALARLLKMLPKDGHYASVQAPIPAASKSSQDCLSSSKMESHNHPSQVEPRQGAATGIGGIIRDIFTVGARPIANLNSLRFGLLETRSTAPKRVICFRAWLMASFLWKCNGHSHVAGEVGFHPSYRGNCLVGAMSVGVVRADVIASSAAAGVGNTVMYFRQRDGARRHRRLFRFASHEITDSAQRPTVQVGDPFSQKCLLEATLEALQSGAIVSMKTWARRA